MYVLFDSDSGNILGYSSTPFQLESGLRQTITATAPDPLSLYEAVTVDTEIQEYVVRVREDSDSIKNNHALIPVRRERDEGLRRTDWTQLADIDSETRASWTTFRQALRDIPQNYPNGQNVVWPDPPS